MVIKVETASVKSPNFSNLHTVYFDSRCTQWDVNNENLHGNYFEEHTGDRNISMKMYDQIYALDPNVELFLNDYGIISAESGTVVRLLLKRAKIVQVALL